MKTIQILVGASDFAAFMAQCEAHGRAVVVRYVGEDAGGALTGLPFARNTSGGSAKPASKKPGSLSPARAVKVRRVYPDQARYRISCYHARTAGRPVVPFEAWLAARKK